MIVMIRRGSLWIGLLLLASFLRAENVCAIEPVVESMVPTVDQSELSMQPMQPVSYWIDHVRVGYDSGFVVASDTDVDLQASDDPFRFQVNGWGQLRHTALDSDGGNPDLNQFQLKQGRG